MLSPCLAMAQQGVVRAQGQTVAADCAGRPAEVSGNGNKITFSGICRELRVRGGGNVITIQFASGAALDIEGSGNRIRYTMAGGSVPPTLRISGNDTDVAPEPGTPAPQAPAQAIALTGDGQRLELDCTDRPVSISGNRSRYVLRGGCRAVVVHGDANGVVTELMPGAAVEIEGNGTGLTYTMPAGGEPQLVIRGINSSAIRTNDVALPPPQAAAAWPAATSGPAPPPLPLAPIPASDTVPVLMHELNATVVAEGTLVIFQADMLFDAITANLHNDAPGRLVPLIELIRQINPSGLLVTMQDRADLDLARKRAMALQGWLSDTGQIKLPIKTAAATGEAAINVLILR